jgi:acetate---CoA ligase (ADP-forming)
MNNHRLAPLMQPRSIAVVGASARPETRGYRTVRNLIDFGFKGAIYPINRTASEICGLPAFSSLRDIPEAPDCAAVAIPAEQVNSVLRDAASVGVRAAVVFASGFAEAGREGVLRQQALQELSSDTGLLVCGPNCLGLANIGQRISLYSSALPDDMAAGGVGLVSHSGSVAILLSNLGRLGFSHIVSGGNSAVLDAADYLDYFVDDNSTRVAALFIESIRNPTKFADAARRMHDAGKLVVALIVGRSKKGAAAAAAHTGSLAGSDDVYRDFLARLNIISADDLDEFVESTVLASSLRRNPHGTGIGVINVSGGEIALTCDIAQRIGAELPDMSTATIERLKTVLPDFASAANPLDATGAAVTDLALYGACIEAIAADPNVAVVAVSQDCPASMSFRQADRYRQLAVTAADIASRIDKPLVFYSNLAAGIHPHVAEPLTRSNVPVLQGARGALQAIHRLTNKCATSDRALWRPLAAVPGDRTWRDRLGAGSAMTESEVKAFLAARGLSIPREISARTGEEAVAAARKISFPVAMKIESPEIQHKTDAGGVRLGLQSDEEVSRAFTAIIEEVRSRAPHAHVNGVSVQEMVAAEAEMIVALARHEPFGLAIVVGCGGVLVELLRDSALGLLPVDRDSALELIERTRAGALLRGHRGARPSDIGALADLLVALSDIAASYGDLIDVLELNPVAVLPAGAGVRILDALLVPRKRGSTKSV